MCNTTTNAKVALLQSEKEIRITNEAAMRLAIAQAHIAHREGEVPIGAVIFKDGVLVALGHNRREGCKNALKHAEIEAIDMACKRLGSWRLTSCTLFVTLEPCPMCAGAIINSRISAVVYGASDPKAGVCGSIFNLFAYPFNHMPRVTGGVLESECGNLLTDFFQNLRKRDASV